MFFKSTVAAIIICFVFIGVVKFRIIDGLILSSYNIFYHFKAFFGEERHM